MISLDEATYQAKTMPTAFMTIVAPNGKKVRVQVKDAQRGDVLMPDGSVANVDAIKALGGEWSVEDLSNDKEANHA